MYERVYDLNAHVRESGHVHDFTLEILLDSAASQNVLKRENNTIIGPSSLSEFASQFGSPGASGNSGLFDRSTLESHFAENPYLSQLLASGQYASEEEAEESVDDFDGQTNGGIE